MISKSSATHPVVRPVPKDVLAMISTGSHRHGDPEAALQQYRSDEANVTQDQTRNTTPVLATSSTGHTRSDLQVVSDATGQFAQQGVSVVQSSANLDVHIWKKEGDAYFGAKVELTKLPNWIGLDTSSTTVQLPRTVDQTIQIILGKAAQKWNGLSGPVDNHLPAIVQRRIEDLGSTRSLTEGSLKRRRELSNHKSPEHARLTPPEAIPDPEANTRAVPYDPQEADRDREGSPHREKRRKADEKDDVASLLLYESYASYYDACAFLPAEGRA
jgi:hypothetical protein